MLNRREVIALAAAALVARAPQALAAAATLVFVHGRQQGGFDRAVLRAEWSDSLAAALERAGNALRPDLKIAFPYYGDDLDRLVAESKLPMVSDIVSRGDGSNDELLQFQARLVDGMIEQADVPDALIEAEYGDNPTQRGPLNWEWVQASIRALDRHTGLTAPVLEAFTRDVYLYINAPKVRRTINGIVAADITTGPTVVVAHSLGSVVAYDLLRGDLAGVDVPLFVTLGSPLGIRTIRTAFQPLRHPAGVKRWFNGFDERDYVALYPLDDQHFAISPAIENFSGVRNAGSTRHAIVDYLSDDRVADTIFGAL